MKSEKFHQRLCKLRKLKKQSAKEIASKIGVPLSTYREWEYGRAITGEPYLQIAEALQVGVYELLGGNKSQLSEINEKIRLIRMHLDALEKDLASFF